MAKDERIDTLIFGSVSNLEHNLTRFLAEADDAEIVNIQKRLTALAYEARQLVSLEE